MIQDYSDALAIVVRKLGAVGFTLEVDADYYATLTDGTPWKIVFEGERYVRPAFDLQIVRSRGSAQEKKFSTRILMTVFDDPRKPSLENQLNFLVERRAHLMVDGDLPYEPRYEAKNAIY